MQVNDENYISDVKSSRKRAKSKMGQVNLIINKGQSIKLVGAVYGAYSKIREKNFESYIYLDHYNQRLKLLTFQTSNYTELFSHLEHIAKENNFDKILSVVPQSKETPFLEAGFIVEAHLTNFFGVKKSASFLAKYLSPEREFSGLLAKEESLINQVLTYPALKHPPKKNPRYNFRPATKSDIPRLLSLYRKVFETYPSPLIHQDYLESIFKKESIFYVAEEKQSESRPIIAAASAELYPNSQAAEMTDCATLKPHRGNGLMIRILWQLEKELKEKAFTCAYTSARARSYGMNLVFHRLGYNYLGKAKNQCDIQGTFENMNYWSKNLS